MKTKARNTETVNSRKVVVHMLYNGQAICGLMEGVPRQWPVGHIWSGPDNSAVVSCVRCQGKMVEIPEVAKAIAECSNVRKS